MVLDNKFENRNFEKKKDHPYYFAKKMQKSVNVSVWKYTTET